MGFEWNGLAVVTGAGSGIGRATALALAARGARILVTDRDAERARAVAAEIVGRGGRAGAEPLDVTDRAAWRALAERLLAEEVPRVLVNNAGVAVIGPLRETSLEDWDWQLGVNLMGPIHGCQLLAPAMAAAPGRRHIVNVASAAGFGGLPLLGAYSVSKTAVVALSQALAAEHDPAALGVSAVCPGFLPTRIGEAARYTASLADGRGQRLARRLQERRGRGPEDVARAIVGAIEHNRPLVRVYREAWTADLMRRALPTSWALALLRRSRRPE